MGTKFITFNVKNGNVNDIARLLPSGAAREAVPGWVTCAFGGMEAALPAAAKRISKDLSAVVLYTEYFDDDYVDFVVYQNGKRVARHFPAAYEDEARKPGSVKQFSQALSLDSETEKKLRLAFTETDQEESVRLMSYLLRCPIWVFEESITEAYVSRLPDDAFWAAYAERIKASQIKIKNQMKLTLRDEMEGDFCEFHFSALTSPLVRRVAGDLYEALDMDDDGKLRRLFTLSSAREADVYGMPSRAFGVCALFFHPNTTMLHVYTDDGELLDIVDDKAVFGDSPNIVKIIDDSRVYKNGVCYNFRRRRVDWTLAEIGGGLHFAYNCPPVVTDDGVIALKGFEEQCVKHRLCVVKTDGAGFRMIPLDAADALYPHAPLPWHGGFMLLCGGTPGKTRVACFDETLNERWHCDIDGEYSDTVAGESTGLLYLKGYYTGLAVFDVARREVTALLPCDSCEEREPICALPGARVVLQRGDFGIDVLNDRLALISRHRTKGAIADTCVKDGRLFVLSGRVKKGERRWEDNRLIYVLKRPACAYVYELTR